MKIKLNYFENTNFLDKSEWTRMIHFLLQKIYQTNIGKLLIDNIDDNLGPEQYITISNYSKYKSFQYPCYNSMENSICIPETPYFIDVPVISKKFNYKDSEIFLQNIFNSVPLNDKLSDTFIQSFSSYRFQPYYVILFHELVHCLRHLKDINSNHEEESTIYGIKNQTLIINGVYITENNFRKEVGLLPRISHDSRDKYIYKVTKKKLDTKTLKEMFFLLK